jgi:hypothetical protein
MDEWVLYGGEPQQFDKPNGEAFIERKSAHP